MPLVLLPCCLIFFSLSSRNGSQSSAKTFPTFISCFSRFLPILQSFGTYRIVFTCWFCSNFTQQLFTLIDGAPFACSYRTKLCFSSLGLVNGVFVSCFFLHCICWWNVLLDVLFFAFLFLFSFLVCSDKYLINVNFFQRVFAYRSGDCIIPNHDIQMHQ